MAHLFNCRDYKEFLLDSIRDHSEKRGHQGQLATAAGCQPAYLSQVLRSHVHLTLEHACNLAHFFGFDELETSYFITLVDYGRAGSGRLQQRLKTQLEKLKKQSEDFAQRLKEPTLKEAKAHSLYYSAWYWGAIHILVSIPEFQTPAAIGQRLNLPVEQVLETLRGLKSMGLVKFKDGRWNFTGGNLHIPKDSPLNGVNHQNWRMRAIQDSHTPTTDAVHYSFTFAVSHNDFEKLKTMLLKFIDEQRKLITPSPCEELACFTYDLFRV